MKRFCVQFLVGLLLVLFAIGVFNYVVDPCYHYHRPFFGAEMQNQVYQTPGAAQHFSYDGVIAGSSMTENFRSSWFAEEGNRNLKLSYSGGRTLDLRNILEKVFLSGNDVRYVWTDLNDYQLTTDPLSRFGDPPLYLYDGVGFDDVQYLYNSDVFRMSAEHLWKNMTGALPDLDDAYTWEDPELFSAKRVLAENQWAMSRLADGETPQEPAEDDGEQYFARCEENLRNLLPIVEAHPDTQFVFYFPPYSMLYWGRQVDENRLWILDVYRHGAEMLLQYDNVRVFYFQDEKEIISDLNNYRDECHHAPWVNRYIFDSIMEGRGELTPESVEDRFADMKLYVETFRYEELLEQ